MMALSQNVPGKDLEPKYVTRAIWKGIRSRFHFEMGINEVFLASTDTACCVLQQRHEGEQQNDVR
jgi:hypothetical protein